MRATGMDARSLELRRTDLSGTRSLVVRSATDADVDGICALYDRLDDDARYYRFFSMYRPARSFYERMVRAPSRGGATLVAEVIDSSGTDPCSRIIVAEADFEPLPNGDGELAITVDAAWRGWLGPYLLDALLECAAACGLPNLEAEVLASNRPMRSLLRARGQVTVPRDDWNTVRLLVGTTGHMPAWPPSTTGRRVLIEGSANGRFGRAAASAGDVHVLACAGPTGRRDPCPALTGKPCPLVTGADVVVVADPPDTDDWNALRRAHQRLHRAVPVFVELCAASKAAGPTELALTVGSTMDALALVKQAADESRTTRPR